MDTGEYAPVLSETRGLQKLGQHGNWVLWKFTDAETANMFLQPSKFCKGQWCVKDPKFWKNYANQFNAIYVFEHDKHLVYCFDTKTGEFKNADDQNVLKKETVEVLRPFKEELQKDLLERRTKILNAK